MHTILVVKDYGKAGYVRAQIHWQLSSCLDCYTVQYAGVRSDFASGLPKIYMHLCTLARLLVHMGIFPVYSVLLIAWLGIHVAAENHVSFQGAFVCPGYRPHIFVQVLRVAEGHSYLYPYDLRGHVYEGQISLTSSHDIIRL